ncbi:MAG: CpsD/CapB family tyrosine-protein kinase [Nitrospirota bacterium]
MSGQKSADPINVEDKPLDMESVKTPRNPDLISVTDAESPVVEQYRHLFSRVDLACKAKDKRVIAVTSCAEGEGKTVTVSNLAIVAARDFGRRVMLIDADFRHPTLSNYFKLESGKGLIDVLMRQADLEKVFVPGPHPNLTILPMGQWSQSKRENVNLGRLKEILPIVRKQYHTIRWEEKLEGFLQTEKQEVGLFDYVFVDTPPIMPGSEMYPISEVVDAILLVVRSGDVSKRSIQYAAHVLDSEKIIGAVLNRASVPWPLRYNEYMYYGHNEPNR